MLLLMGIQGSGKGTQGKMLAEARNYHLMSMGDVLRAQASPEQQARMLTGELLTDDEVIQLVDRELDDLLKTGQDLIFDGFPRSIKQAEWLVDQAKKGRITIDQVIHLKASRAAVKLRLLNRGRADDTDSAIDARFDEYERSTEPVLSWLAENDVKINNVDAERDVDAVNQEIIAKLDDNQD